MMVFSLNHMSYEYVFEYTIYSNYGTAITLDIPPVRVIGN